jgi:dynein heavy chain
LLKILSQGSDPQNVQEDLEKLFDSISRLEFDKLDKRKITRIKAIVGNAEEVLDLTTPVMANGNIEDWLTALETEMQKSVRRECKYAASISNQVMNGMSIKDFADKFIAQVALLGIQQIWTTDFQDALVRVGRDKDRQIMSVINRKFQQILSDLVSICLTDLGSKMNRTKFETLVTIHVHQRDLFNDIWKKVKEHRIKDEGDFEWLKQTRFYWKSDIEHAIVSIADVDFTYSYEYLGVKERLVITPLTDRCYLTLSQALGICYGGAPAGPAGTGKTETVKDLSRTLGIACVVTNCSDQHRSRDMASIFKGTCSGGVWSCFDEFNRIELEVLSVVAMQIEAVTFAKKQHMKTFMFPGERAPIKLSPSTGYFITMNPGYAGRQQLPNNLAILFRSVSMMVPDREIIMKVKLASVGYSQMDVLGKKFNILYQLCEQQLSKQRHYDFGLRNILSVLRTAGGVQRTEPPDADEEMIFMRTVRDMNLSKLVADDVPLFLALLKDLFPKQSDPPKKVYKDIEDGVDKYLREHKLVDCESWKLKVIQLYETSLVRHGLMLVGPSLCGKTEIINVLSNVLTDYCSNPHRVVTINPKAITDSQMYGVKDAMSDEWTPGVFASIWQKYNNRSLKYTTWIVCDGPVDAIWIENLNSVLDDNKILTLANNDRIAMTDNCRILFEVENLNNASPATVSRAGIIFVSASDLGWKPLIDSWLAKKTSGNEPIGASGSGGNNPIGMADENRIFAQIKLLIEKLIIGPDLLGWFMQSMSDRAAMSTNESMMIVKFLNLLDGQLLVVAGNGGAAGNVAISWVNRVVLYAIVWGIGGLLDTSEDRIIFNSKLLEVIKTFQIDPVVAVPKWTVEGPTLYEYWPGLPTSGGWELWKPEEWVAPKKLNFSSLLIPTVDSIRAQYLMSTIARCNRSRAPISYKSSLLLGSSGTAKTSTVQMYLSKLGTDTTISKRVNFSSATTPYGFQRSVEMEVERKTGKTFCPPNGKKMVLFIDDMSMPMVNKWGDQVTLEIVRQLIEFGGFYFLDKDKRGDFKSIEDMEYIGSTVNPGGGRNDIPNRIKSKFFSFSMVMPTITVVDSIYGSILRARFSPSAGMNSGSFSDMIPKLTTGTISVWEKVKKSLLPTPQRFHYVFNMRDLSRVFQGILEAPLEVVIEGGPSTLLSLWRHECTRVFTDKLCREVDKDTVAKVVEEVERKVVVTGSRDERFGTVSWWSDFQRDPVPPADGSDDEPVAPKIYEPVFDIGIVRRRAYEYLAQYNEHHPSRKMKLVLFDDALGHLMKIVRIIQQKRGSAMLVGVGGSGKQSLTRLAAFICNKCRTFQIAVTKSYNENAFFDDLRNMFVDCGQKNIPVTFILTDAEIKSEEFLEHMNSFMATGEVSGLFQKDERESMCAEIRNEFVRDRPGLEDTLTNLYQYFLDRLCDNLHVIFCFSPVGTKFSVRAQKFPAIFSNSNINWFLPWPTDALVSVAETFLNNFEIAVDRPETRVSLYKVLGAAHASVNEISHEYSQVMRRKVYVTPKNFLCLIELYQQLYAEKLEEVVQLERSVSVGLSKLNEAAADVERLKIDLREEEVNLKIAEESTNNLLYRVQSESVKAETQAVEVGQKKDSCLTKKAQIEQEQAEAEKDLQAALPFLREAENAVKSITAKDITELKTLKQPSDIIRLVFDGLLILQPKENL